MSLNKCIEQVSGLLRKEDITLIRNIYADHTGTGMDADAAAMRAVSDVIELAMNDRASIVSSIEKAGGVAPEAPKIPETPTATEPATEPTPEPTPEPDYDPMSDPVVLGFRDAFNEGKGFKTIVQARKLAEELGFTAKTGDISAKQLEEKIELAVVLAAKVIAKKSLRPYEDMVDLYERMPNLNTRTSGSVVGQEYSTPIPIAYLAQITAGILPGTKVFEPTAGNGALVLNTDPKDVIANELNPMRNAHLVAQGYKTTQHRMPNAQPELLRGAVDSVIMNPPFGPVKGEDGKSIKFNHKGFTTLQIDEVIAMNGLEAMPKDGTAVLILGGIPATDEAERSKGYSTAAKRKFYARLYKQYNVVDHYTIDGKLYSRQGAAWPVDVIVIQGRGQSQRALPAADVPEIFSDFTQLKEKFINARQSFSEETKNSELDEQFAAAESQLRERDEGDRGNVGEEGALDGSDPIPDQPDRVREPDSEGQRSDTDRHEADNESVERRKRARDSGDDDALVDRQVAYHPASKSKSLNSLIPASMQDAVDDALAEIAREYGSVDQYVAEKLNYEPDKLSEAFAAEQIDAVALAVANVDKGAGFVLGDQTGIGKGRVNAAMIRYAIIKGLNPIFVTDNPGLYVDMVRDTDDIALPEMLGRDLKVLPTNNGFSLKTGKGRALKTGNVKAHESHLREVLGEGDLGEYDVVFTTYAQMNPGTKEPYRREFLSDLARNNSFLILDESHLAGGKVEGRSASGGEKRSTFIRGLVTSAHSVFYSSATYAKRPDLMDIYSATDMALAVDDIKKLAPAIQAGGIPMQTVVANMLVKAKQYLRRERSYDGISYKQTLNDVDMEAYDNFATAMRGIHKFSTEYMAEVAASMDDDVKSEGGAIGADSAVGNAGASSTNFGSVMHNLINQMLLSMSADVSADLAIAELKAGRKPSIAVSNTMESFLKDLADDMGLQEGDILNADFREVLKRYLKRSREVLVVDSEGNGERVYATDAELGPDGVKFFESVMSDIDTFSSDLPISPIDRMIARIEAAGYSVGEITGRALTMNYRGEKPTLSSRPQNLRTPEGKRQTIEAYNGGDLDVIILNRAGSTGLSIHASETFKDQRPRHMIIAQSDPNIDVFMQMLGRINRSGQVVLPSYTRMIPNIPAAKRPAAVESLKLKSLNASTTASGEGSLDTGKTIDFMNMYGDEVAMMVMRDDPDLNREMGHPVNTSRSSGIEGNMRKLTGRIPLLKVKDQLELYERLESEYLSFLAVLDAAGENTLDKKTLDLKAVKLDQSILREKKGPSVFEGEVVLNHMKVRRLGKPMTSEALVKTLGKTLGAPLEGETNVEKINNAETVGAAKGADLVAKTTEKFIKHRDTKVAGTKDEDAKVTTKERLDDVFYQWRDRAQLITPGARLTIKTNEENLPVIVLSVKQDGKPKNPAALGSWKVHVAVANSTREMTIPFSRLYPPSNPSDPLDLGAYDIQPMGWGTPVDEFLKLFDDAQGESFEERYIATGNILAGFEQLDNKGNIIQFTTKDGKSQEGVLLGRNWDADQFFKRRPVIFNAPDHIVEYVDRSRGGYITNMDEDVEITRTRYNSYEIKVPSSKAKGGQYFTDPRIIKALGDKQFIRTGREMRAEVYEVDSLKKVIAAFQEQGTTFSTREEQDLAGEITGQKTVKGFAGDDTPGLAAKTVKPLQETGMFYHALEKAIENHPQEKTSPQQWAGIVRKANGVTKEEQDWTGILEWLDASDARSLERSEVLAQIKSRAIGIEEVTLTDEETKDKTTYNFDHEIWENNDDSETSEFYNWSRNVIFTASNPDLGTYTEKYTVYYDSKIIATQVMDEQGELVDEWAGSADTETIDRVIKDDWRDKNGLGNTANSTRWKTWNSVSEVYSPDEMSNYRENVYTVPNIGNLPSWAGAEWSHWGATRSANTGLIEEGSALNAIGHTRLVDVTWGELGGRALAVTEIQSDIHQRGKRFGYNEPGEADKLARKAYDAEAQITAGIIPGEPKNIERMDAAYVEWREAKEASSWARIRPPKAPFKNVQRMMARRVFHQAVSQGYDALILPSGDLQNDLYGLQVTGDSLEVYPGSMSTVERKFFDSKNRVFLDVKVKRGGMNDTAPLMFNYETKEIEVDPESHVFELYSSLHGKNIYDLIPKDKADQLVAAATRQKPDLDDSWLGPVKIELDKPVEIIGEGMRQGYDRIIKKEFEKVAKGYGGKFWKHDKVWVLDITPEMREGGFQPWGMYKLKSDVHNNTRVWTDLARDVTRAVRHMAGQHADLELIDNFRDAGGNPNLEGEFKPLWKTIIVALEGMDALGTAHHEVIHALRNAGVFTSGEWASLERMAKAVWMKKYKIRERYGDNPVTEEGVELTPEMVEAVMLEEAIAHAFTDYVKSREAETLPQARTIFEKLQRVFAAIKSALKRNGITQASDLFENVATGKSAKRPEGFGERPVYSEALMQSAGLGALRNRPPQGHPNVTNPFKFPAPPETAKEAWTNSTLGALGKADAYVQTGMRKPRAVIQDYFLAVQTLQNQIIEHKRGVTELPDWMDVYELERIAKGKIGSRLETLQDEVIDEITDMMKAAEVDVDDVGDFLMARHAPERNKFIGLQHKPAHDFNLALTDPDVTGASGMSLNEVAQIMAAATARGKYDQLVAISDKVYAMQRASLRNLRRAGMITQKDYLTYQTRYQYYVPLRGFEGEEAAAAQRFGGKPWGARGPEWKRAKGRRSKAENPLVYAIAQTQAAIVRVEYNTVAKGFFDLITEHPNDELYEIKSPKSAKAVLLDPASGLPIQLPTILEPARGSVETLGVKIDGKQHIISIHHKEIREAMRNMNAAQLGTIWQLALGMNRWLSAFATSLNPPFILSNFIRDGLTAGIHLQKYKDELGPTANKGLVWEVYKGIPKAIAGIWREQRGYTGHSYWSDMFREFSDEGGKTGWMLETDVNRIRRGMLKSIEMNNAKRFFHFLGDFITHANNAVENGVRLSTYVALKNRGYTRQKAAVASRTLTVDFNKKGEWGVQFQAAYLFFGPAVQGTAGMMAHIKDSKRIRYAVGGMVMTGVAMDLLNRAMSGVDDDDELFYDKIPKWIKEGNFIFMIPGSEEGDYIKIPQPWGYNAFHYAGTVASEVAHGAKPASEGALDAAMAFFNSFNPLSGNDLASMVTPTAGEPLLQLATNRDSFGRSISKKPAKYEKFDPPKTEQHFMSVNPFAKYVTDGIAQIPGYWNGQAGDAIMPASPQLIFDHSPEVLEYWGEWLFKGLGKTVSNTIKTGAPLFGGPMPEAYNIPVIRRIYGKHSRYGDRQLYRYMASEVHRVQAAHRMYTKAGATDDLVKLEENYPVERKMWSTVYTTDKFLRKKRKIRKRHLHDKQLTPDKRRELVERVEADMDARMMEARRKFVKLKRKLN